MKEKDAPIAFSPGFRWVPSLLPGSTITMEEPAQSDGHYLSDHHTHQMTGAQIKAVLEDDRRQSVQPHLITSKAATWCASAGLNIPASGCRDGKRIQDMRLDGKPLDADKTYKVAGWQPVSEAARTKAASRSGIWSHGICAT